MIENRSVDLKGIRLSFFLCAVVAAAMFLPYVIFENGLFLYSGDFNEQQIPFYMYANRFIKQWSGTWSWQTDLGSSFISSYSFYNLGSPFLWLSLIVPSRLMPFAMVPLFILKFGCIGASGFLYLSQYAKNRNSALICSVVYAFCGFNIYNIFFNHMLEPVIIFPLMLWSMDVFIEKDVRGAFALSVGLALLNSYFFFVGNVVFLIIYFIVKVKSREYALSIKKFLTLAFEAVLGVGIGMVLALPSFISTIQNPRASEMASGLDYLIYGSSQRYLAILVSTLMPPDPPYLPTLFPDAGLKWSSMSLYLPIVGLCGVIAYLCSGKKGSVRTLICISAVMAFIPVLNSSFFAFNASYYARWYYMPLLTMVLATLRCLDDPEITLRKSSVMVLLFTVGLAVFGLLPVKGDEGWSFGVEEDTVRFWVLFGLAFAGALIFCIIVFRFRGTGKFSGILLAAVMLFSAVYSVAHMYFTKSPEKEWSENFRQLTYDAVEDINLPDDSFYRIDTYDVTDNLCLWLDQSSIRTFNSVVNASIMEFYPFVGVTRDVGSRPETDFYALRGLLSVRFTLVPTEKVEEFLDQNGVHGWDQWAVQGAYTIFENQNYIPMGFTYDQYVKMDYLEMLPEDYRSDMLVRAVGLDREQILKYKHLFEGEAIMWDATANAEYSLIESESGWYQYENINFDRYVEDSAERRSTSATSFDIHNSGFSCDIALENENLVFFSVPYDEGFTATVNGSEAEVLRVSGGMMAVYAPEGDNHIEFTYRTPGFRLGGAISIASIVILIVYVAMSITNGRRKSSSRTCEDNII